ncbi:MAG: alpha/beta fold hydrolase [Calditrichota bacterium]
MKLYGKRLGNGPPLIILHGLLGSSDNWFTLGRRMSESYNVHLLDQRNHGRSPHDSDIDYRLMANDVVEYARDNGLAPAILIGHSMGGKTAMSLAANYPERVSYLVILDIAPKKYPAGAFDDIFAALQSLNLSEFQTRGEIDTALAKHLPEAGLRGFLLKNIKRASEGGFGWKMNLPALATNLNKLTDIPNLPEPFTGPCRFVNGSNSRYVQPADHPQILQHFPNADFRTVDGAGHWVHAEKPEGFMQSIADILNL